MPNLREYLAIIPDLPNALDKRMAVRAKHLESFKTLFADGVVTSGGGLADEFTEPLSLNGSAMTILAENKDQVMDILSRDIYATSGVWDLKNVKIHAVSIGLLNRLCCRS